VGGSVLKVLSEAARCANDFHDGVLLGLYGVLFFSFPRASMTWIFWEWRWAGWTCTALRYRSLLEYVLAITLSTSTLNLAVSLYRMLSDVRVRIARYL